MNDKSKESRIAVRIDAGLHNWVKMYAQRENKTMSILITEYLSALRQGKATEEPDNHLKAQIERADSEIRHLREQVSHLTQVVAMSQKNIGALTEQLLDSQQMISEMRQRKTVWQRFKAVFVAESG
ncbi:MAG: hypothetical protein O7E52_07080 [Candidatus Poribacteria bacterium]|nr:hypothetical protein [Candidatus Poribacteria bacterium]